MKYLNFDLWVGEKRNGTYPLSAQTDDNSGEHFGTLVLDPNDSAVVADLHALVAGDTGDPFLKKFGGLLFEHLFTDNIGHLFKKSLGKVEAHNNMGSRFGLRTRLRIKPPEIAALPWELLYDKDRDCFLATSVETPVTRYIEVPLPINDLQTALPINVLIVIPNSPGLDTKAEKKSIAEALEGLGGAALRYDLLEGHVTIDSINRALNKKRYNIFHFIGHGDFYEGQGHLLLNSGKGENPRISADEFAYFFKESPWIKLVILNSCQSAMLSAVQPLSGVAHQVVKVGGVPAVVAMQYAISDEAAKSFADDFYQKLCLGFEPGRVDAAISHARKWVRQKHGPTNSFITPVLLMRSRNGIIFDLDQSGKIGKPLDQLQLLNEVATMHHSNIAVLDKQRGDKAATPEIIEGAAQAIQIEQQSLAKVKSRVWWLYGRVAASAAPRLIAVILCVAAIVFFANWVKFFNVVHFDDLVQNLFVPHLDAYVKKKFSPEVRLIVADKEGNDGMGEPADNPSWRPKNAALLRGLRKAGARVIVFDLTIKDPSTQFDEDLIKEIKATGGTPTSVIAGKEYEDGKLVVDLAPDFKAALNQGWGNLNVGGLRGDIVSYYQLAYINPEQSPGTPDTQMAIIPSLALQAVMQYVSQAQPATAYYDDHAGEVRIRGGDSRATLDIPVMRQDDSLDMFFDLADIHKIRNDNVSFTYKEVYDRANDQTYLSSNFSDNIVLIGYAKGDQFRVIGGGERLGIEIQANVISNLLEKVYIYTLPTWVNILVIMLMAACGVLLQTKLRRWLRFKLPLPIPNLNKNVEIPSLFFIVIGIYLLAAFLFYQHRRLAFDMSYHIVALWISYVIIGIFRKELGFR